MPSSSIDIRANEFELETYHSKSVERISSLDIDADSDNVSNKESNESNNINQFKSLSKSPKPERFIHDERFNFNNIKPNEFLYQDFTGFVLPPNEPLLASIPIDNNTPVQPLLSSNKNDTNNKTKQTKNKATLSTGSTPNNNNNAMVMEFGENDLSIIFDHFNSTNSTNNTAYFCVALTFLQHTNNNGNSDNNNNNNNTIVSSVNTIEKPLLTENVISDVIGAIQYVEITLFKYDTTSKEIKFETQYLIDVIKQRIIQYYDIFGINSWKSYKNDDNNECKICFSENASIILLPCRHCCICLNCFRHMEKCPLCRTDIKQSLRWTK